MRLAFLYNKVHKATDKSVQVQGQKNEGMRETGNFDRTMKCLPITFLESQLNVERDLLLKRILCLNVSFIVRFLLRRKGD